MSDELIDPDIRKAHTLPSRFYTEESVFSEVVAGFSECWHFAAHVSQLAEHNVLPLEHMERFVGESMLLTRDDGFRCLSNVCTHRGMLVSTEACSASVLRCGYHGRTFGLDGCMRNMPSSRVWGVFPSSSDDLREFDLKRWNGLLFAGNGPSRFADCLAELECRVGWMPIESFEHDPSRHRSYEIDANWALYVDNYLEGFHIPYVHGDLQRSWTTTHIAPSCSREVCYRSASPETQRRASICQSPHPITDSESRLSTTGCTLVDAELLPVGAVCESRHPNLGETDQNRLLRLRLGPF
ncbi:MAG: hypothetical protein Ct9H300mP10_08440 [Methanobacteriota archaeon]|nr:MAG: hypothetical protein Ct9H300mP10_08440 [Euryarchaeota archaeon]